MPPFASLGFARLRETVENENEHDWGKEVGSPGTGTTPPCREARAGGPHPPR
jgi:hypothetical protein